MNEKKGQVKGWVYCPNCGTGLDLSKYYINAETLSEEVAHGQYKRPRCICGCKFGYHLVHDAVEEWKKWHEVNTVPQG